MQKANPTPSSSNNVWSLSSSSGSSKPLTFAEIAALSRNVPVKTKTREEIYAEKEAEKEKARREAFVDKIIKRASVDYGVSSIGYWTLDSKTGKYNGGESCRLNKMQQTYLITQWTAKGAGYTTRGPGKKNYQNSLRTKNDVINLEWSDANGNQYNYHVEISGTG